MDHKTWTRICALFDELVELPPEERPKALALRGANDNEIIRREVERMLVSDARTVSELDAPLARVGSNTGSASVTIGPVLQSGDHVGGFVLDEILGEGGMATVWSANQQDPARTVAIKMQRGLKLSATSLARFRYETQVLARLRHPAIARLYEAGTHWRKVKDDWVQQPYLAMEYVEGSRDLVSHARSRGLDISGRLALFEQVCAAVTHAHQNGVLHRDLKAQNLLVDGEGHVKVIDFGIARPVEGRTESEPWTLEGQMVGTLSAMSPEQLAGEVGVDARADVYALGCVLYELLEDHPPFDLADASLARTVELVREGRREPMSRAPKELRWVIAKAMAPIRNERYASVAELEEDLRRFRAREPLHAGPASRWYAVRKYLRRHRTLVWASLAVLGALGVGLYRTDQARRRAVRAEEEQRRLVVEAQESETEARRQMQRAVEAQNRVRASSLRHAALHLFVIDMIQDGGGPDVKVIDMLERARGGLTAQESDPLLRAGIEGVLSKVYETFGLHETARELIESAVTEIQAHGGPVDNNGFQVYLDWMHHLVMDERYGEAREVAVMLEPLAADQTVFAPDVYGNLVARRAALDYFQSDHVSALEGFETAIEFFEQNGLENHEQYWLALSNLGTVRLQLHDYAGGLQALERRLSQPDLPSRSRAATMSEIGKAFAARGEHDRAIEAFLESYELFRSLEGPVTPNGVTMLCYLGEQYLLSGDLNAARMRLTDCLEIAPNITSPPHYATVARYIERYAGVLLGWIALHEDDPLTGLETADAWIAHYGEEYLEPDKPQLEAVLLRALCLEALGKQAAARTALSEEIDWQIAAHSESFWRHRLFGTRVRLGLETRHLGGLAELLRGQIELPENESSKQLWRGWLDEVVAAGG